MVEHTIRYVWRRSAAIVMAVALCLAAPGWAGDGGDGGLAGVSDLIDARLIVRVRQATTLEAFIAAWEADHPGMSLAALDSIEARRTWLLGVDAPDGTSYEVLSEEIETQYLGHLVWGEALYENAAPEAHGTGSTGSVFVDGVAGFAYPDQYGVGLIGLSDAHTTSTGAGALVAVVDTGVDASHPQLAGRIAAGGWDFVDGDGDPSDVADGTDSDGDGTPDELVGHGTFVAGLVHLVAPDAYILPVRALNGDGFGDAWTLTRGIQHAIDRGADVINLSLGSTYNSNAVNDAIAEAMRLGAIPVSAAGNLDRNEPREFPAMRSDGLGIAATDRFDVKSDFSNFDDKIFMTAPGTSVVVDGQPDLEHAVVSTFPGGGYAVAAGTSMAVPFVSGAAALIRAQHPEWPCPPPPPPGEGDEEGMPNCAYLTTSALLEGTAHDIYDVNPAYEDDELLGAGRLDAAAAVAVGPIAPGPGDVNHDGVVDVDDLVVVITGWGACSPPLAACAADVNRDGVVNVDDLVLVLLNWS